MRCSVSFGSISSQRPASFLWLYSQGFIGSVIHDVSRAIFSLEEPSLSRLFMLTTVEFYDNNMARLGHENMAVDSNSFSVLTERNH